MCQVSVCVCESESEHLREQEDKRANKHVRGQEKEDAAKALVKRKMSHGTKVFGSFVLLMSCRTSTLNSVGDEKRILSMGEEEICHCGEKWSGVYSAFGSIMYETALSTGTVCV